MHKYVKNLEQCAHQLYLGEGSFKILKEIHPDLRVKRSGHHFVFGLMRDELPMLVLAILHEKMDLISRVKNRLER